MVEVPTLMPATNGTGPPTSEPEIVASNVPLVSMAQRLDIIAAEHRKTRMELDEANIRLFHTRICLQSETQSRQTLQQGLDTYQRLYVQLVAKYTAFFEGCNREIASLREDHQVDEELIASQKQLLELYQSQQQQQQSNSIVQGGPLLPQYAEHDHQCQICSPYQSTGNDEFVDTTSFRPGNDFDYNMFPGEQPCDQEPVMPTQVNGYENRTHNLPIQSVFNPISTEACYNTEQAIPRPANDFEDLSNNLSVQAGLHPISAERDTARYYKSEKVNIGSEEEVSRPNKKQKAR